MQIIKLNNDHIKKFQKTNNLSNNALFNTWYDDNEIFSYGLIKDKKIISIALLSNCDYNNTLYILNYIYTLKKYRKQGYAFALINYIKHKINFIAFCMNYESEKLFEKAGLFNYGKPYLGEITLMKSII